MDSTDNRYNQHSRIVALINEQTDQKVIAWYEECSVKTVQRWQTRSEQNENLHDQNRSGRPRSYTDDISLKVIAFYCQLRPFNGKGQWTLRWAQVHLQKRNDILDATPSKSTIHRILKRYKLHPHLNKYFLQVSDPDFFPKMEHIIETYNTAGEYLFCFDECPGVQVLKRLAPKIQSINSNHQLKESFYNREGTVDILSFLQVSTGKVMVHCSDNHKGEVFRKLFTNHVKKQPSNEILHYIMDNLSSHSNMDFCRLVANLSGVDCELPDTATLKQRQDWLGKKDKRIIIHFTPFHGSWLNMVESWFSILRAKCLDGEFQSKNDIIDSILQFSDIWTDDLAKPFHWEYTGQGLHQKVIERIIQFLQYNCDQLELGFWVKQMHLVVNIIKSYDKEVSHQTWHQLSTIFEDKKTRIKNILENEKKDKVRKKAEGIFSLLSVTLNSYIEKITNPINKE